MKFESATRSPVRNCWPEFANCIVILELICDLQNWSCVAILKFHLEMFVYLAIYNKTKFYQFQFQFKINSKTKFYLQQESYCLHAALVQWQQNSLSHKQLCCFQSNKTHHGTWQQMGCWYYPLPRLEQFLHSWTEWMICWNYINLHEKVEIYLTVNPTD